MYAQDERKRDVVIKLVQTDSVEHRIHQHLMSSTEFNHSESFPFIIPTLEILPSPHNFLFVIMPRWVGFCLLINGFRSLFCFSWGAAPCVPDFRSVRELLSFIVNILQVRIPHYPRLYIYIVIIMAYWRDSIFCIHTVSFTLCIFSWSLTMHLSPFHIWPLRTSISETFL